MIAIIPLTYLCFFAYGFANMELNISSVGKIVYGEGPPDYTIWTDGTYTYAIDAMGNEPAWSANVDAITVINHAISSTNGGRIFVTPGTYVIRSAIFSNGKSNIELYGAGEGQTIIQLAANQQYPGEMLNLLGSVGSYITGWYVHDLTLDGNSQNQGSAGHLQLYLQYLSNSTFERVEAKNVALGGAGTSYGKAFNLYYDNTIVIRNCTITLPPDTMQYYAKNSIALTQSDHCLITNNTMVGGSNYVLFFDGAHDNIATHNVGINGSLDTFDCYVNAYNNFVSDNLLIGLPDGSSTQAMYIQNNGYPTQPCYNNTYMNNTIINYVEGIILGRGGYNNYLINNTIINCAVGINVMGGRNSLIYANNITNCSRGIALSGDSTYNATGNTIIKNTVSGDGTYVGIDLTAGSRNIIVGNNITNNVYGFGYYANGGNGNYAANNTVTQSIVSDVTIQSDVSNCVFEYNDFASGLGSPIHDGGTNTLFRFNAGYSLNGTYSTWQSQSDWQIIYYNLTVSSSSGGTIDPPTGVTQYLNTTIVPITFTANTGHTPTLNVDGANVPSTSPYCLVMNGDHTANVIFTFASSP